MWSCEHTESTAASPAQVWRHYADPGRWPEWDNDLEWVTVSGPMASGTTGVLKPAGGPRARFVFTEVTEGVGFTDVSRLPLARMAFAHEIEPAGTGSRLTHRITITGPLAPLFGRVIGRKAAAGLPGSMRALAALAESV